MEAQFGLAHVWQQGDWVTRTVAVILLAMSLASWIVIIIKALDLRRFMRQSRSIESFWHAADFADGLNKLGTDPANPFRSLALEGREAARGPMMACTRRRSSLLKLPWRLLMASSTPMTRCSTMRGTARMEWVRKPETLSECRKKRSSL